jgi:hypothetical protein
MFVSCVLWFHGLDDTSIDSLSPLSRRRLAFLSRTSFHDTFRRVKTIGCGTGIAPVHIKGDLLKKGKTQVQGQNVMNGNSIMMCRDRALSAEPPTLSHLPMVEYAARDSVEVFGASQILEQEEACGRGSFDGLTAAYLLSEERTRRMLDRDGGVTRRDLQLLVVSEFRDDLSTGGTSNS